MTDTLEKRNARVEENLGLVHACANRFRGRGVEYEDLFQAGCVGLIKAADKFDESLGYSFSTYAFPVIFGEVRKIFREGGTVKVGRTTKERARLALKEKERLVLELGRDPTVGELAEALGMDAPATAELLNLAMPVLSLTPIEEGEQGQTDIPVESHENGISERLAVEQVLATLSERDRTMIQLRFFEGLTQSVTAKRLGMSQVQVSRREKKLLEQMRALLCP